MSIKINDSTANRPAGHRLIDAPAVQVNFTEFIQQLKEEKAWATSDRNAITVFKTQGITIVVSALHKGAEMNDLHVEGLLLLQVMEGAITVTGKEATASLPEKQMLILHAGSTNTIVANEDTVLQLSYIKMITSPEESSI